MEDVTFILNAASSGDKRAASELLPIIYRELRELASTKLAQEKPGQTLQATALVHEAYLRLTGKREVEWNSTRHFFGAAAEAMRRILIEQARKRKADKHGGGRERVELDSQVLDIARDEKLLQLDEAIDRLATHHQRKANVVNLRFFAGLTNKEAAAALDISEATADRDWTFARAWLYKEMDLD